MCLHAGCVADPDVWWHMRVAELIQQNHAVLRTEPFSRELMGTPWLAYSWLFELLLLKIYQWFGVMGIVGYSTAMVLAITVALNHMLRRIHPDFIFTVLLTYTACFSLGHLYTPRPWMFSILFFIVELDIFLHARKTGRTNGLAWLPLIFALWANIHIEFIYGLFVAGVVLLESLVAKRQGRTDGALPLVPACFAVLTSGLATLATPFGWRIYSVIYNLVTQGGGLRQVSEMQAIPFRDLTDYCLLGLALAAVGALAWTRRFRIFESGLLLFAIFMAFREQRDAWLISVAATAVLASTIPSRRNPSIVQLPRFAPVFAVAGAICTVLVAPHAMRLNKTVLQSQIANVLPVHAVDAIRERGYQGPVFNDFNWGGYLIWALRQPVTIDGRTNLYGNERMDRSIATWGAARDWASDPQLTSARLVIGSVKEPLVQVLRLDSHYKLVYEDKVAAVFVAEKGR